MKEDTIIFSKRSKHDHFTQDNKLKETLQDLISEPESDENTILIHETQQKNGNTWNKSNLQLFNQKI